MVSSSGKLSGVTIEGAMDSCYFTSSRSGSKGEYSLSAPLSSDLSPYYLTVQYYSPYYSRVNRKLQVGGLPLTNIYLPPTYLPISTQQGNGNVHVRVYDVLTNTQIDAQVLFRTGYNNFTGPFERSFSIVKNSTLSLEPGVYSVVASASKYKLDTAEVVVNSDQTAILSMLLPRDDIDEDAIRVVLGWKSQNLDLDLHVTFKLDEKYDCDVSYAYKHCGGAKIQSTNIYGGYNGGEVIDLYEVGNTTYLFYIKDFRKDSSDLPIENKRLNILQSEAEVKVYTANYDEPVVRLQVPDQYPWPDSDPNEFRVWLAFCMKGAQGLESLSPVKAFLPVSETPILYSNICS